MSLFDEFASDMEVEIKNDEAEIGIKDYYSRAEVDELLERQAKEFQKMITEIPDKMVPENNEPETQAEGEEENGEED